MSAYNVILVYRSEKLAFFHSTSKLGGRGTAPASLYGSLGVKPGKICKMDYKKIHLTYLVRGDVKRDVVSKKYRDTLRKRIEAVVDTISPLYGNGLHKRTGNGALVFV